MSDKAPEQDEQMTATSQTAALGERKKKLERERQELEQLKLEIERKKIELERQRLEKEKRRLAELKKTAESSRQEKAEKPIGEARPKVEGHDMRVSVSPNNQKKPVPPQTASVGIREKMPVEPPKDQYRLAVFPWYTEKITGYYTNMFLESNLNAIARVFHEKEAVFITQSYYLHDKFSRTVKIIKEVLNKKGVKGLWMKKSMFSELEPDINRVIGYGRDLKVDLVLMINTDYYSWNAGGPIKIYLIDISNEKPYSGEFHNPRWPRLVSEEVIEAAMKRVMNQFLSGRLKSQ